jgi:hypothetical protein
MSTELIALSLSDFRLFASAKEVANFEMKLIASCVIKGIFFVISLY